MAQPPFRFIHASDLHLERPLHGAAELPERRREALADAPFRAAERLFDAALAEQVAFVILAGDVLDAAATGPRGPAFLVRQFERLAAAGVSVYWAAGHVDRAELWPAAFPMPDNVHWFASTRPETVVHSRGGEPLARLVGAAGAADGVVHPRDFDVPPDDLVAIVVAYGETDRAAIADGGPRYWALGGAHQRDTWSHGRQLLHYPGTLQGRLPSEAGPHGAALVQVDVDGVPRVRQLPCDVVRWQPEHVTIDAGTTRDELNRMLAERVAQLAGAAHDLDQLVIWNIDGAGPLAAELRRGRLAAELLAWLRREFTATAPGVWSVSLSVDPPDVMPVDWYEQDTLLGEFLRAVRTAQASSDAELFTSARLPSRHRASALGAALRVDDAHHRQQVLAQAAALGADYLGGEDPLP